MTIHMDMGGMEVDTPYYATFVSSITFNTKITEMESSMNRQNEETQNLLRLIMVNQGIGTPIPPRNSQGNDTSGSKWVDSPSGTGPPIPDGVTRSPACGTYSIRG